MTAIEAVACYLPRQQVRLFKRFLGLAEIRLDPGGSLVDLLRAGVAGLEELRGREHLVRYVMHARVMPVVVPYPLNPLRELCRSLGLSHAVSFAVTHHACASAMLAIDLAGRLLAADGDKDALALILAGEKAFTRDAQLLPGISVFGEAAAACLVRSEGPRDRILAYASSTRGEFFGRLDDKPGMATRYEEEYPASLGGVIQAALSRAGLGIEEITLLLPHNVNVMSWRKLCRRIGLPVDRVLLDNVPVTGHAFCVDAFLNYTTAAARGLLRPGVRYVIAGAGLGATFSAMVVEH